MVTDAIRRAVVAVKSEEVAEFLRVHLHDRGFTVELAYRPEYLATITGGSEAVISDIAMWREAAIEPEARPRQLLLVSASPSLGDAVEAAALGAVDFLAIPFADARKLALTLDAMRDRSAREDKHSRSVKATPEPELVGV